MDNYLLIRTGPNFRLGAGIDIAEEAAVFDALCGFLKQHALLAPSVVLPAGGWEGFELRAHDLTEEGLAVMKCGLDRWLTGQDKGKPASDVGVLEKCLAKVRKAAGTV
ncbi:hypothetical protein GCM10027277_36430 [Pseudoduganella ginsengisoli]|uniref:Uncharacterized protein n=1 Tax=Pseudoduganella ginsengisoli TaxID=1462440 RepID=A0A6L6PXS1_9BURK|nr:hypothetical protein [Pseudoduganella ginsengisoli]MTW02265.1 hypothetical protein [Pseudoduganella ginsengisoli]